MRLPARSSINPELLILARAVAPAAPSAIVEPPSAAAAEPPAGTASVLPSAWPRNAKRRGRRTRWGPEEAVEDAAAAAGEETSQTRLCAYKTHNLHLYQAHAVALTFFKPRQRLFSPLRCRSSPGQLCRRCGSEHSSCTTSRRWHGGDSSCA